MARWIYLICWPMILQSQILLVERFCKNKKTQQWITSTIKSTLWKNELIWCTTSIKRGSYCDDKAQERRSDPNAQFSRYDFWRTHTHVMVHCCSENVCHSIWLISCMYDFLEWIVSFPKKKRSLWCLLEHSFAAVFHHANQNFFPCIFKGSRDYWLHRKQDDGWNQVPALWTTTWWNSRASKLEFTENVQQLSICNSFERGRINLYPVGVWPRWELLPKSDREKHVDKTARRVFL